jgi:hypothetical protein
MTATETQEQQPRTSRIAIVAFVFSIIGILVLFAPRIPLGLKISLCLGAFGIGVILGISALVEIRLRNPKLVGGVYAVAAISLGLLYTIIGMNNTARFYDWKAKSNLRALGQAITQYCASHEGHFPPAEHWCDALMKDEKTLSLNSFRNPFTGRCFAFNKNLGGLRIVDVSDNIMMLFPGNDGRNISGGPELFAKTEMLQTYILLTNGEVCEYSWFDKGIIRWDSTLKKEAIEPIRWNP